MNRFTLFAGFVAGTFFLAGCYSLAPNEAIACRADNSACQPAQCESSKPACGQCDQQECSCGKQCNSQCQAKSRQGCGMHQEAGHGEGHQMHGKHGKGMHEKGMGMHAGGCGAKKHAGHGGGHEKHAGMGGGMHKHGDMGCGMMQMEAASEEVLNSKAPGASQFIQACSQCHGVPDPTQHVAEEWDPVIDRMLMKMEHHGMEVPAEKDQQAIREFLKNNTEKLF